MILKKINYLFEILMRVVQKCILCNMNEKFVI